MTKSIQIHGWQSLPCGSLEYADYWTGENCDGFCAYVRTDTPDNPGQPFDITEERDFADIEAAESYALELAARHACEVERY